MQNRNVYMLRKVWLVAIGLLVGMHLFAQQPKKTKTATDIDTSGINAVIDYDEFFSLMDHFFDSLYTPRSFAVINANITSNYYSFIDPDGDNATTLEKITFNPSMAYYDKSGLGISAAASIINNDNQLLPFQYALIGSYDYIKNRKLATGISFTRYFTKDSLSFYTSPLQNQVSSYFTYRKWWIRPLVTVNYGWGSRSSYLETIKSRQIFNKGKGNGNGNGNNGNGNGNGNENGNGNGRGRGKRKPPVIRPPVIITNTTSYTNTESVNDFTIAASLKHDFYWIDVVSKNDFIRLTPQFTFTSGTQRFGFNQVSTVETYNSKSGQTTITDSKSAFLDNSANFRLLAVTAFLKSEFSIGKFFVQPTVMVDYYVPASSDNISTTYLLNAGFIF